MPKDATGRFGFPDSRLVVGIQPAVTIYAWNEVVGFMALWLNGASVGAGASDGD